MCGLQGHGRATTHKPELVLNNFGTRLGRRVGRMFASLFSQDPAFRGRRVVTFHNQRDFVFFRWVPDPAVCMPVHVQHIEQSYHDSIPGLETFLMALGTGQSAAGAVSPSPHGYQRTALAWSPDK